MLIGAKKPCEICRRWFRPNDRIGSRQRACSRPECQAARRKKTQASWRARNPGYSLAWRIQTRSETKPPPKPLCLPAPLSELPWDFAHEQFGPQGAGFVGAMGSLLLRAAKDQIQRQIIDTIKDPATLPLSLVKD